MEKPEDQRIPTNEEVIDEVTKDLARSRVRDSEEITVKGEAPPETERCLESDTPVKGTSHPVGDEDGKCVPSGFDDEDTQEESLGFDDTVDEVALKDLELTYSEEERNKLRGEAKDLKEKGNELFKAGEFRESAIKYTQALRTCPLYYSDDRAVSYSNRAAAKSKLGLSKSAIEDCSKAVELNDRYLKAYLRRAQLYVETEKLDEALEDYKKVLEIEPYHPEARKAASTLPSAIQERNEKLKTEMFSKLKDVGNMLLRPFGLSTDDFQLNQDPNTGGYSISMGKR